jgi:hypothetical protein
LKKFLNRKEEVRHTPSYWEAGTVNTLLDHNDWEGEIREVKCFSNFVIGITLSSKTHGLRSSREDSTLVHILWRTLEEVKDLS